MADYEKECFMVQGFSANASSNPAVSVAAAAAAAGGASEFVQDAQQGKTIVTSMYSLA